MPSSPLALCLLALTRRSQPRDAASSSARLTASAETQARGGDECAAGDSAVDSAASDIADPAAPKPDINGNHVMQYVKEIVAIGSRPVGSPGHAKLEQYILSKLKGDDVEQDTFTAQTPVGKFPDQQHHRQVSRARKTASSSSPDTTTRTIRCPKLTSAPTTAARPRRCCWRLADQFRGKQLDGYSVWLVWTDGEEAFVKWTDTDSLYGTRHLAQKWQQDGTAKKIKAFILVDMIGDADLDIQHETNSTPWLSDLVYQAATNLGYQSHFYQSKAGIEDDHLPFLKIGVPAVDIIDLDYGYNNVFHHTAQDTIDKLSPQSLAITGDVVLETIRPGECAVSQT